MSKNDHSNICGHFLWRGGIFPLPLDLGQDLVTAAMCECGRVTVRIGDKVHRGLQLALARGTWALEPSCCAVRKPARGDLMERSGGPADSQTTQQSR